VRCAEGWCGIEVKDNKECGRIAFHFDAGTPKEWGVEFSGRYEKAEGTEPYVVKADLSVHPKQQPPNEQLVLSVLGSTDGDFQPWRRTYPLHMVLVRDGDAVCRTQQKLSSAG
jgi:hypothetical protein